MAREAVGHDASAVAEPPRESIAALVFETSELGGDVGREVVTVLPLGPRFICCEVLRASRAAFGVKTIP